MKTKPLNWRHEKRPIPPIEWKPRPESAPHRVRDGDTWYTIARNHNISALWLIHWNFWTTIPEEVNWYLREYVGCNVTTDGGRNWAFSNSAVPGIIYKPPINFQGEVIEGRTGVGVVDTPEYDDSNFYDTIEKSLDIYGAVDLGIGVFEVALPLLLEGGLIVVGAAAALMGPLIAIGSPQNDALRYNSRNHFFEGFSVGLVMSANGATEHYIKQRHELHYPPYNPVYPEKAKTFQNLHNFGLLLGIKKGKQFNTVDIKNFFTYLHSQLKESERQEYTGDFNGWSEAKKKEYYGRLSSIVKKVMLDNNLQLKIH